MAKYGPGGRGGCLVRGLEKEQNKRSMPRLRPLVDILDSYNYEVISDDKG